MKDKSDFFRFMLDQVKSTAARFALPEHQAFARWFTKMYFFDQFSEPKDFFPSDGSNDGKIDAFFSKHDGKSVTQFLLNTKFTEDYNRLAPPTFYEEISYLIRILENKPQRNRFLEESVRPELRPYYSDLFNAFDDGRANVYFVTNLKSNDKRAVQLENSPIHLFHLDDLIQHLIDDIDMAMPHTPRMTLSGIGSVLSPEQTNSDVSNSIVFAKLIDFINYMKKDPHGLLFARNVRISLGNTSVNKAIKRTFKTSPEEFVFSNNGITMLCDKHRLDPGTRDLLLDNPRVVNGAQTLHSLRDVPEPSESARIMVRIIEIPPFKEGDVASQIKRKKDIIDKIAVRTNQQNPIKKWNLVANDSFQMEVYRWFRQRQIFYERRDREWTYRSASLKAVNIKQGPSIKSLTQAISSFNWSHPSLGPVISRRLEKLFSEKAYNEITKTKIELAYQIYLLDRIVENCRNALSKKTKYISNLKRSVRHVLFSLVVKSLQASGLKFGTAELTKVLEQQNQLESDSDFRNWDLLVKACIDLINDHYSAEKEKISKSFGEDLTVANYLMESTAISELLAGSLNRDIHKHAKVLADLLAGYELRKAKAA